MMVNNNSNKNYYCAGLSVDVEDGISIVMHDHFNIIMDPTDRVISNTNKILRIFKKNKVRGTFFILGEVAENYPDLLKQIDTDGHEIGVHGYNHEQIFKYTPERLKETLSRTKHLIEDVIGKQVFGFRAPAFSIDQHTSWALSVIAECEFFYDSSIFPSKSIRYGWEGFPKDICKLNFNHSLKLIEVPLSVTQIFGKSIPVGGGGYLRYFPLWWTKKAIANIIKERPAVVYLHPYELDKEKYPEYFYEALSSAPLKKRMQLRFYRYKKDTVEFKLNKITKDFHFAPMIEIIQMIENQSGIREISL